MDSPIGAVHDPAGLHAAQDGQLRITRGIVHARTSPEFPLAFIEAKGAQQPPPGVAKEPVVLKLLDALKQSLAAARQDTQSAEPKRARGEVGGHGMGPLPMLAISAAPFDAEDYSFEIKWDGCGAG